MVFVLSLTLIIGLGVGIIGDQMLPAQQAVDIESVKAANQAFYEAFSGRDMTVFLSICRFFAAVVLTLFGVCLRTTIGTFSGVNEHLITPLQSHLQRFRGAQLAIRH
jgi:hypothetical protein